MTIARALWITGQEQAELRDEPLAPLHAGSVRVRTLFSGLSRGTERLVFSGAVPPSEYDRMRSPLMGGDFPFPVKYGYSAVGTVEDGPPEMIGQLVFALAPHQDFFTTPKSLIAMVPGGLPPQRAVLAANMETALNAVWDSGAGPGDAITVVGAGIVGLLIARLCARLPGTHVHVVDIDPARQAIAEAFNCRFLLRDGPKGSEDVVFHTSASPEGFDTAIKAGGLEATIVEVSWYGETSISANLGCAFHTQRLKLISSQVGHVSAARRPRWNHVRRRTTVMQLLDDPALDRLLTEEIAFADLPAAMPRLLAPGAPGLQTLIRYN